jgi:hypothetical protein
MGRLANTLPESPRDAAADKTVHKSLTAPLNHLRVDLAFHCDLRRMTMDFTRNRQCSGVSGEQRPLLLEFSVAALLVPWNEPPGGSHGS